MPSASAPDPRQAFITGLRDLAWYLATHSAVPVPAHGTDILVCVNSTDDGGCAQVDRFARQLGVPVEDDIAHSGHYEAGRFFGPVSYRMLAISQTRMARYHAGTSYSGCVIPDTTAGDSHA